MKNKSKKLPAKNTLSYKVYSLRTDISEIRGELQGINNHMQAIRNGLEQEIRVAKGLCNSAFNLTAGFDAKITRCIDRVHQLDEDIARIARSKQS